MKESSKSGSGWPDITEVIPVTYPNPEVLLEMGLPGGGGPEPLWAEVAPVGQRTRVQAHVNLVYINKKLVLHNPRSCERNLH